MSSSSYCTGGASLFLVVVNVRNTSEMKASRRDIRIKELGTHTHSFPLLRATPFSLNVFTHRDSIINFFYPTFLECKIVYSLQRNKTSAFVWSPPERVCVKQPWSIGTTMLIDRHVRNSLMEDAKQDLHLTNSTQKSCVKKHAKVSRKNKKYYLFPKEKRTWRISNFHLRHQITKPIACIIIPTNWINICWRTKESNYDLPIDFSL